MTTNQNLKRHLKCGFAMFQTSSSLLYFIYFFKCGENFWVKSERTLSKVRKKKHFCVVFTDSTNRAREIRNFHVTVGQQRGTKRPKKRDARAKLFFCQSKPIAFLLFAVASREAGTRDEPLRTSACEATVAVAKKLPIVVIHEFCYRGNVTPHFSSLLREVEKLKHLRLCCHFTGHLLRRHESHTDRTYVHT